MIDLSKTYRTRDGREVRLSFIDGDILYGHFGKEQSWTSITWWAETGRWSQLEIHQLDLIEVKPRIKREAWVNVYPDSTVSGYPTKSAADDMAATTRIACVKITIDCEHGEGL